MGGDYSSPVEIAGFCQTSWGDHSDSCHFVSSLLLDFLSEDVSNPLSLGLPPLTESQAVTLNSVKTSPVLQNVLKGQINPRCERGKSNLVIAVTEMNFGSEIQGKEYKYPLSNTDAKEFSKLFLL